MCGSVHSAALGRCAARRPIRVRIVVLRRQRASRDALIDCSGPLAAGNAVGEGGQEGKLAGKSRGRGRRALALHEPHQEVVCLPLPSWAERHRPGGRTSAHPRRCSGEVVNENGIPRRRARRRCHGGCVCVCVCVCVCCVCGSEKNRCGARRPASQATRPPRERGKEATARSLRAKRCRIRWRLSTTTPHARCAPRGRGGALCRAGVCADGLHCVGETCRLQGERNACGEARLAWRCPRKARRGGGGRGSRDRRRTGQAAQVCAWQSCGHTRTGRGGPRWLLL